MVEDNNITDLSNYLRMDSYLHPMYSLDIIDNKLVFNNAWDINRSTSTYDSSYTGGYILIEPDLSDERIIPYARVKYDVDLSSLVIDEIYSSSIYGTYDSSNSEITFETTETDTTYEFVAYLAEFDISNTSNELLVLEVNNSTFTYEYLYDLSTNLNPLTLSKVTNPRKRWETLTTSVKPISDYDFYDQSNSVFYSSVHSKYQPQILYSGDNSETELEAEKMLDLIKITLEEEGSSMRYEKNIYLSFRKSLLKNKLNSYCIINGEYNMDTVPFVYFTNETDDDDIYHPFMVIASYGIPDRPVDLVEIYVPIGESGTDYEDVSVFRDAIAGEYLIKIPIKIMVM